jgi:hypothetical protein
MAHFPDLSPYNYSPFAVPGTLNVGWLDRHHPFPVGPTCERNRARLQELGRGLLVNRTAGFHVCEFCPPGGVMVYGASELHVAGPDGRVYAAPSPVLHYVCAHRYRPPDEFIEAVMAGCPVNPEPTEPCEVLAGTLVHRAARLHFSDPKRAKELLHRVLVNYSTSSFREEAEKLLQPLE